jgi:hypothetical protein
MVHTYVYDAASVPLIVIFVTDVVAQTVVLLIDSVGVVAGNTITVIVVGSPSQVVVPDG